MSGLPAGPQLPGFAMHSAAINPAPIAVNGALAPAAVNGAVDAAAGHHIGPILAALIQFEQKVVHELSTMRQELNELKQRVSANAPLQQPPQQHPLLAQPQPIASPEAAAAYDLEEERVK